MRTKLVGLVLAGCLGASCASAPLTGVKGGGSTTGVTSSPTTTTRPPSALDDLTAYFAAAETVDQRLKAAAIVVGGDVGTTQIAVSPSTAHAVAAADPTAAGHAIPAGLTPDLLLPVMLVQSDLVSRFSAMSGFERDLGMGSGSVISRMDQHAREAMSCLGNGSEAAASFATDLARARAAASQDPPVSPVASDSRAGADLAVLLENLKGRNSGCMSCGGARETSLPTITWYTARMPAGFHGHPSPVDGNVNGIDFLAQYSPTTGWDIQAYAC